MSEADRRARRGNRPTTTWALTATLALMAVAPLQAQAPERGAFVVMRGADTLAVERFQRTATSLESSLTERIQGMRIGTSVVLAPGATAQRLTLRVWRGTAPDTATPLQEGGIVFQGDTAVITQTGLPAPLRIPVSPGTVPYVNLAGSYLEQIVRRATAAQLLAVPVLVNTTPVLVTVTREGADSVVLGFGGTHIRLAVDSVGRMLGGDVPEQGIRFLRVADARLGPAPKPDYSAPAGAPYTAQSVTVTGPTGPLAGTLTLPSARTGRIPAVVTITGSGLEDRDESLGSIAPGYRPFRQVADTLGRRGIAVLRLDDRGFGESGGDVRNATSEDFARDIEAGVAYLRSRPEIDPARIGLVGHSEGGIIAPMVAAADPTIRAIVLMAGTAYNGRQVLEYQIGRSLRRDSAMVGAKLQAAVEQQVARMDSANAWTRFFTTYEPLPTAGKVRVPVLILQGAVDRQVTAEQAPLLEKAFKEGGDRDVTLRVFPERNHLFLRDATGDPANYPRLASYVIDGEVMGTLADWLVARLAAPAKPARTRRK